MTEFRVNGFEQVRDILTTLKPFIRFKAKQTQAMIDACALLSQKFIRDMSKKELRKLVTLMFIIRTENYKSRSTLTKEDVNRVLGLTP